MTEERIINLRKERTISLTKGAVENGESLKHAFTGLRWGKILVNGGKPEIVTKTRRKVVGNWFQKLIGRGEVIEETYQEVVYPKKNLFSGETYKDVDLDSSILVYDKNKKLIDKLYFGCKKLPGLTHYGDDLVGTAGIKETDNETIRIDFDDLPKEYEYLVVILNSYSHDKFDNLPYMQMRIYESKSESNILGVTSRIFAEYRLDNSDDFKNKEALCLGAFSRCGNGWKFTADGSMTGETSIKEMSEGSAKKFVKTL